MNCKLLLYSLARYIFEQNTLYSEVSKNNQMWYGQIFFLAYLELYHSSLESDLEKGLKQKKWGNSRCSTSLISILDSFWVAGSDRNCNLVFIYDIRLENYNLPSAISIRTILSRAYNVKNSSSNRNYGF